MSAQGQTSLPNPTPLIEISLAFDRPTHSFTSDSTPPIITFSIKSSANHPITSFTWQRPLHPRGALTSEGYTITDLATGPPVKVVQRVHLNRPLRRMRGTTDEELFLTVLPGEETRISANFGPSDRKPLPHSLIKSGHVLDETGKELNIRRSPYAYGVEGLVPGHQYRIGLNVESMRKGLWAPVVKDQILVDSHSEGSSFNQYLGWKKDSPLDFVVKEARLDVLE